MWTTLSSLAEKTAAPLAALLGSAALVSCTVSTAPDSPRPARVVVQDRPATLEQQTLPFEARSVTVRRFDASLSQIAGPRFLETARDPLVIEVQMAGRFTAPPQTSSPVIVLNGTPLTDTWVHPEARDRLVAFLPDRRLIRDYNTVSVRWVGKRAPARPMKPLTFTPADIR